MSNLGPSARQLVRAGTKAARPSDADRERVFEAMRARLGDTAMLGAAGLVVSPSVVRALWVKVSACTLGVGLLVGGAVVALRPAPEPPVATVAVVALRPSTPPRDHVAPAVVSEPNGVPVGATVVEPLTTEAPPVVVPAPSSRRPSDRLAQEVALLSRATSALRSGRAADALKALSEHQSQFPKGVLAEERRAARAQALCALGRRNEAEAELARLAPQSPQSARALQACSSKR
jgi:hypothetical protein